MLTFVRVAGSLVRRAFLGIALGRPRWRRSPRLPPPSVVFILLDTTRADRLGAWGGPNPTSPNLDALAASGIRFAAHFANAHATRPSMPQLMTGRYYHQNVLHAFRPGRSAARVPVQRPGSHGGAPARGLPGSRLPDPRPSARTRGLPRQSALRRARSRASICCPRRPSRGHAGAAEVVDAGSRSGRSRRGAPDVSVRALHGRPHAALPSPRRSLASPSRDTTGAGRFRPDGEPDFDRARRSWNQFDASDFTPDDRRYFAAVYDTLAGVPRRAPRAPVRRRSAATTPPCPGPLIVVDADHGEELGEDGRIDHGDSLADAVQHVPWIMAGGGIPPGQVVTRITENVDVMPTLLSYLHVPLPPGTHVDGRPQLGADGTPCAWMREGRSVLRLGGLPRASVAAGICCA